MNSRFPKLALLGAALAAFAPQATAEPVKLDGEAIRMALTGKSFTGVQDGKEWSQDFFEGGDTTYIEGDSSSAGRWRVDGDRYCSLWPPSEIWTCYQMATDGDDILFIESGGTIWRAHVVQQ